MSKMKFQLNYAGVGELLHSSAMEGCLMGYANTVAGNAGDGYKALQMGTRVIVVTDTEAAAQDNLDNNTLLKAVR